MFQTFVAILHRKCDLRRKIMLENVILLRFFFIQSLHISKKKQYLCTCFVRYEFIKYAIVVKCKFVKWISWY